MPSIERHSTPVLYMPKEPGAPRHWLMTEHPAFFSLANLGSYHQRHLNQLLSVCSALSHYVSFMPALSFPALRSLERSETLYANEQPFVHTATLEGADIYARQPSAAETAFTNEVLAAIQFHQAVPLISFSLVVRMLKSAMMELEALAESAGCLDTELDRYDEQQWHSDSETASYYGLSGDSADYWEAIHLLKDSMQAYAQDKELALDA